MPPNLVYYPHTPHHLNGNNDNDANDNNNNDDNNDNNDNNNNNSTLKAGATEPGLLRDDAVQTRQRAPGWSATGSLLASFANGHEKYWIVIMLSCIDDNADAHDQNFDCLQFMDSASEGVLLVSFGSVLQGSQVCCFLFSPKQIFLFLSLFKVH